MLSLSTPNTNREDSDVNSSRPSSILSRSDGSSSTSSVPVIPFKPLHLRSTSSQARVQARIIQNVEIAQTSPAPTELRRAKCLPPFNEPDQATIKAIQRRAPRKTASAMRELMESDHQTILHPMRLESEWNNQIADKLNLDIQSDQKFTASLLAQDEVSNATHQSATFKPLITPQQAVALYCFNPEVFDSRESGKPDQENSEKITPEIGFEPGDRLEIWVPDIGGGWSLGKNVSNSKLPADSNSSGSKEFEVGSIDELGLIPIGWYKLLTGSEDTRRGPAKKYISSSHYNHHDYSLDGETNHPQVHLPIQLNQLSRSQLHPDQQYQQANFSTLVDQVDQLGTTASDSLCHPLPRTLSNVRISSSSNGDTITGGSVDKGFGAPIYPIKPQHSCASDSKALLGLQSVSPAGSHCFILPSSLNPSIAVNKEFDSKGVCFDYPSRGFTYPVAATNAIWAAFQTHDLDSSEKNLPRSHHSSKQQSYSWYPFLSSTGSSRHSIALSYIVGQEDNRRDLRRQDTNERYEIEGGPVWKVPTPVLSIQVHSPRLQKPPSQTKPHVTYTVTSLLDLGKNPTTEFQPVDPHSAVDRRYSHFERLHHGLNATYGEVIDLPSLPEKTYTSSHDGLFIENRRRALERYLVRIVRHPVLRYSPILTTFLECKDVETFEREARHWGSSSSDSFRESIGSTLKSSASSSFFSKVFHPDYNVDEADANSFIEAFNKHTKSLEAGGGLIELEKNLNHLRNSIQDVSQNFQKISSSIQKLCAGLPSSHKPLSFGKRKKDTINESSPSDDVNPSTSSDGSNQPGESSRNMGLSSHQSDLLRSLRDHAVEAGLQNSDGALCWKKGCTECLSVTKALQLLGESLETIAGIYSDSAIESLAPVQDILKELSFPHKSRQNLSKMYDSSQVSFSDSNGDGMVDDFESRKETVLNVVMSEIERHHQERNMDIGEMAKALMDSQIDLYQAACQRLEEARKAFQEPQLGLLGLSGPRPMNSEEAKVLGLEGLRRRGRRSRVSSKVERIGSMKDEVNQVSKVATARVDELEMDGPISTIRHLRTSSVLEWINCSRPTCCSDQTMKTTPDDDTHSHRPSSSDRADEDRDRDHDHHHHHRNYSQGSNASLIASSAFSSVFIKPISAAFSSMVNLSDHLS